MPSHARTAGVLSLPLLLTACSGGGGTQSSPQSLTVAVYDDVHAGEFSKVCGLLLPEALKRITDTGVDCQRYLTKHYDPTARAGFADVKAIQVNGDTTVVPESAVTFGGQPSNDGDTKVALQDGKWSVAG